MNYGCKKEIVDKRDYKLKISASINMPKKYEIDMPNVKNQRVVNSCVAHSLSTFMEEYYKSDKKDFSTGFIYGYRPNNYYQGEGMYPREALKTLQKVGNVLHSHFPYNIEMPNIKRIVDANLESLIKLAEKYKIKSYARIYTNNNIKKCLFNECPVPISIPVYNGLKLDKNNVIQMPDGEIEGYHMTILYGWNEQGFLLQNSWGDSWGNKGCAILPYNYPIDSAWAISMDSNKIETKQNVLQKISVLLQKLIERIKLK